MKDPAEWKTLTHDDYDVASWTLRVLERQTHQPKQYHAAALVRRFQSKKS